MEGKIKLFQLIVDGHSGVSSSVCSLEKEGPLNIFNNCLARLNHGFLIGREIELIIVSTSEQDNLIVTVGIIEEGRPQCYTRFPYHPRFTGITQSILFVLMQTRTP